MPFPMKNDLMYSSQDYTLGLISTSNLFFIVFPCVRKQETWYFLMAWCIELLSCWWNYFATTFHAFRDCFLRHFCKCMISRSTIKFSSFFISSYITYIKILFQIKLRKIKDKMVMKLILLTLIFMIVSINENSGRLSK